MKKATKAILGGGIVLLSALVLSSCGQSNGPTPAQKKANKTMTAYVTNGDKSFVQNSHLDYKTNTYNVTLKPNVSGTTKYWAQQLKSLKANNKKYKNNKQALNKKSDQISKAYLKTWNKKNPKQQQYAISHLFQLDILMDEVKNAGQHNHDKKLALDINNVPYNSIFNKAMRKEARESYNSIINNNKDMSNSQKQQAKKEHQQRAKQDQKELKKYSNPNSQNVKNIPKDIAKESKATDQLSQLFLSPKGKKQLQQESKKIDQQIQKSNIGKNNNQPKQM